MKKITDEQLVVDYLTRNDEHALELLVRRYLMQIYGYARNYTGDADNASDITQEVFVKVWKNLSRFDRSKSFRTWIFTIAKRTAIDWMRKKSAVPFSALESDERGEGFAERLTDESALISERLLARDSSRELSFAMNRLSGNHAKIIDLHTKDGMNFRQIAEALGRPLNTVRSSYRRGIAALRKILSEESHT